MVNKNLYMPDAMWEYVRANWVREPEVLARLREETAPMPEAGCQISADQGNLMTLLVRLAGARRILEVGVFTGYSSICMALGMPDDGKIVACDVSEAYTAIARRYWKEAGVEHKMDLRIAPATETLAKLRDEGATFDVVFIDADKPNYPTYYEQGLAMLRPGGLLMVDNVLWSGRVADADNDEPNTAIFREFNARLHQDERIELALVPIADGLTLALKR